MIPLSICCNGHKHCMVALENCLTSEAKNQFSCIEEVFGGRGCGREDVKEFLG